MASIKGLADRNKTLHRFSLVSKDNQTLDFSLREPSGVEETIEFINDFTSIQKNNVGLKDKNFEECSQEEKIDIIDNFLEEKLKFCVKWLVLLSEDEASEDDALAAFQLVGNIGSGKEEDEEESLFGNILLACKFINTSVSKKDTDDIPI